MIFTKIGKTKPGETKFNTRIPGQTPAPAKNVFQIEPHMKIRFNGDGWVEEIGKGGEDATAGTVLQGLTGSMMDDIVARRFYDLYSRVVILEIHPRRAADQTSASGVIPFRDLDPDSVIYKRVNKIIELGNQNFNLNIKPLAERAVSFSDGYTTGSQGPPA